MKHSPEPWHAGPDNRSPCRIFSREGHAAVALVYLTDPETRKRTPEFAGNVALIEAAPGMYGALRQLLGRAVRCNATSYSVDAETVDEAKALVDKLERACP